jgi:hypothetical protein
MPEFQVVAESRVAAHPTTRWERMGPIVAILLLAPIVSELLYGALRVSVIFVLIPEILTWGCGALLIRETVRGWKKGWPSMLLLGLAIAVAEEWVIQQTSIAPLVGLASHAYGRVWGVNWVYLLWAVGYESVWVALLPAQLAELLFPSRRHELWLGTRGFVIASIAFLGGAFLAWYGWTQRARILIFHMPPYSPPPLYILGALVLIGLLVVTAYLLPTPRKRRVGAPTPAMVTLTTTLMASGWAAFVLAGFGSFPGVPYPVALASGAAWCALTLALVERWTSSRSWNDQHRFAVVLGGILGCSIGGFVMFRIAGALPLDWIGKAILDAAAMGWLIFIGRDIRRQRA